MEDPWSWSIPPHHVDFARLPVVASAALVRIQSLIEAAVWKRTRTAPAEPVVLAAVLAAAVVLAAVSRPTRKAPAAVVVVVAEAHPWTFPVRG